MATRLERVGMIGLICGILGASLLSHAVSAEEEEDASPATETAAPAPTQKTRASKSKKKGRPAREKETEGTEAPDRFQADSVIKSEYELDGKKLEVDPD